MKEKNIMRYIFVILALLHYRCSSAPSREVQAGDLLFQSNSGGLSDAIGEVTKSAKGYSFSHVGMAVPDSSGRLWVVEAAGKDVHLTSIDSFVRRGNVAMIGRVKEAYKSLIPAATAFALRQIGTPYDSSYLYGNGKYYCSELIYDAFLFANQGAPFFFLDSMTFKTATGELSEAWVAHYKKLNMPVPEGKPGCNPGGLSRSEKIEVGEALILH
ncbi:MAG: hypothetical protein LBF67_03920 [Prevotellaceae bacterium]|nr:hypothetical protein [Prevotellaceae bacterium]